MVEIRNLFKKFGSVEVLKGLNLDLRPGQVNVIMGPNASGKTTLIKSILGLVIPDRGEIKVLGENIEKNWMYRSRIGYMPYSDL